MEAPLMSYGLDMEQVRYETDSNGNRIRAIVPLSMFSALTSFWIEARRAQTARTESRARPGMYRASLDGYVQGEPEAAQEPATTAAQAPPPPFLQEGKHGRKWADLIARMPADSASTSEANGEPANAAQSRADIAPAAKDAPHVARLKSDIPSSQKFFAREFEEAPPAEVLEQINEGVYFLRAWRRYRGWSIDEMAELFGSTRSNVEQHEYGKARPSRKTLERFATYLDCPVAQLTPKAGSNTQPWLIVIEGGDSHTAPRVKTEPRAPDDTDYPDAVLAHMIAGKSPLTAWRLFRRLTLAQLARQYGSTPGNIQQLEESAGLREATRKKLCPILSCTPAQLLRPVSLEVSAASPRVREVTDDIRFHRRKKTGREARMA
jgi:transcriptional regulator with XRE-family HTH domain